MQTKNEVILHDTNTGRQIKESSHHDASKDLGVHTQGMVHDTPLAAEAAQNCGPGEAHHHEGTDAWPRGPMNFAQVVSEEQKEVLNLELFAQESGV